MDEDKTLTVRHTQLITGSERADTIEFYAPTSEIPFITRTTKSSGMVNIYADDSPLFAAWKEALNYCEQLGAVYVASISNDPEVRGLFNDELTAYFARNAAEVITNG